MKTHRKYPTPNKILIIPPQTLKLKHFELKIIPFPSKSICEKLIIKLHQHSHHTNPSNKSSIQITFRPYINHSGCS